MTVQIDPADALEGVIPAHVFGENPKFCFIRLTQLVACDSTELVDYFSHYVSLLTL